MDESLLLLRPQYLSSTLSSNTYATIFLFGLMPDDVNDASVDMIFVFICPAHSDIDGNYIIFIIYAAQCFIRSYRCLMYIVSGYFG